VHSLSLRRLQCLLILAGNIALPAAAGSAEVIPLYSSNLSPLVQIYGLPALGEARVLNKNEANVSLRMQIANNSSSASNQVEQLFLDGETHRLALMMRQGFDDGYEWGIELPYLSHSGGFMDNFIERWHETFGLPKGDREVTPPNQINYRYTRNGADLVRVTQSAEGLGDIRLSGAVQLTRNSGERMVALRGSLKLPTGDSATLLGSGSTDLALWLSIAPASPSGDTWNGYGGGGILLMTEGDVLPQQQENYIGFATVGLSRRIISSLTFNAQLDAQSPFYTGSDFRQLSAYALQGLLGASWEFSPKKYLEMSFSEDLEVNTSPDFVFNLSLTFPF
jgi:hypothetical protein